MGSETESILLQASYLVCANSLRREAKLCDIILYVQGRMGAMVGYPAHKLILISASKYFKLLLEKEESRHYCHFPHIQEESLFAVLDIIYGRDVHADTNLNDALLAARFLQVDGAVDYLERKRDELKATSVPKVKRKRSPSVDKTIKHNEKSPLSSPENRVCEVAMDTVAQEEGHNDGGKRNSETKRLKHRWQKENETQEQEEFYVETADAADETVSIKMEPDVDLTFHTDGEICNQAGNSQTDSFSEQTAFYSGHSSYDDNDAAMSSFADNNFELKEDNSNNGQMNYLQCIICGAEFATNALLLEHRLTHTGQDHQPMKTQTCFICGKRFYDTMALRKHEEIHSGHRQFECTVCGKRFGLACNLKQHLLTHSSERKFQCSLCLKRFRLSHHLRRHMGTVHRDVINN